MAAPEPKTVTAHLPYYSPPPDGSAPSRGPEFDPHTGQRRSNFSHIVHTVQVENLRANPNFATDITLDTAGFQFYHNRPSEEKTFDDDGRIEKEYYEESIGLIKELTGASRVVIFDHTIRRRQQAESDFQLDPSSNKAPVRQPVAGVHVDQTPQASEARVHRHLPGSDVPALLSKRYQIINLWRPISHRAYDWPLTLCDFRSVDPEKDVVPITLKYPDRNGQTYSVRYSESHRWCYLRGMDVDEVVLIKCFDSLRDGSVSLFTPHTGFEDPSTPVGSPLRESIELRALVFYN